MCGGKTAAVDRCPQNQNKEGNMEELFKSPFRNGMFAIVWEVFKKLYPDKECEVYDTK